jgi:ABC-type sugar transport system permease subunit
MTYARQRRYAFLLAAAPALLILLLQAWPLAQAVRSALTDAQGRLTDQHFATVYADPLFRRAVFYNLLVPIVSVAFEAIIGLAMALWFYELRRAKGFWRTVAIVPFAVPEIVYLLTMKLVFRQHGYLNSLLFGLGGPDAMAGWLEPGSPLMVVVLILVDAWRVTPIVFLIVLTALEQIPTSFLEAARIDGASRLQVARHVLIPLALPALFVALALRTVDAFRIFATPLVLVGVEGMPVLTSVANHYKENQHQLAAANVAALTLAAGLLLATVTALLIVGRRRTIT